MYIRRARQARRRTALPTKPCPDSTSTNHTQPRLDRVDDIWPDKGEDMYVNLLQSTTQIGARGYH